MSRRFVLALTGLAVLCVCAAMAAPMGAGDGTGHRGMMKDGDAPAMNEERMQQMITKMQENGVDTTALETALENGDREAVRAFLQENRPADAPERGEGQVPAMNEERMQQMIRKMQENGVDTTELETALETGDREAVRAFLQENRPADAPEKGEEKMSAMNEGRMQQMMIHKIQANGIDTTELETALENDDMDAVETFFRENKPADAGTGFREGGSSTR